MVQGAWTQYVRRTNRGRLGPEAELRYFLFGTDRRELSRYREVLEDIQEGRCFYCERRLRRAAAVDHFVPWRRGPGPGGGASTRGRRASAGDRRPGCEAVHGDVLRLMT
ncbi:MAG TPA: hypothetical protein VMM12_07065 [Longimicrobiales bacterium]|nr:hypothetical protein [Longimicrobiales bacterium]